MLGKQVHDDLTARSAERGPNGHLASTRESADEQQVRHVRTGEKQQQRGGGRERKHRRTGVANDGSRKRMHHAPHVAEKWAR
jgi:hypothetical protein